MKYKTTSSVLVVLIAATASAQTLTPSQAVALAIENRPAAQASELKVRQAKLLAKARAAYGPLTLGAGISTVSDLGATDDDLYLSKRLDIYGRRPAQLAAGAAKVAIAQAEHDAVLLSVQESALRLYAEYWSAVQAWESAKKIKAVADEVRTATLMRFQAGQVPATQVTRSGIELDRSIQREAMAEAQAKALRGKLSAMIGITPQSAVRLSGLDLPDPKASIEDAPAIRRVDAQISLAKAEVNVADRENRPELELTALRSPWQDAARFGARIQMTWKLDDGGRVKAEKEAAHVAARSLASLRQDQLDRLQANLAANRELQAGARVRADRYAEIRQAAAELAAKSQLAYKEGLVGLLEVLEASRALREVEAEQAEAQVALALLQIEALTIAGSLLGGPE